MNKEDEPTYESHEYHPTRVDGLDRNLRKLNRADWNDGYRCICKACCEDYESSRRHGRGERRAKVPQWARRIKE